MDHLLTDIFDDSFAHPENQIFKVVFYPDRIYHEAALAAAVCPRYRYNVKWVRSKHQSQVLKGEVYLDSRYLCDFLRLEYRAGHLTEVVRAKKRLLGNHVIAWMRISHEDQSRNAEAQVEMVWERRVGAYQVELWGTLEPQEGTEHDHQVLAMMGRYGSITRVPALDRALQDVKGIRTVELAYREDRFDPVLGYRISDDDVAWDNAYERSHQEPRNPEPSSPENTVEDKNYLVDFQTGWFLQSFDVEPVSYRNAMMDEDHPERAQDNIVRMRWILQRELGSSLVYFHEVTVEPGAYEGCHRHVGSEELYYIVSGTGIAYMGKGDDPAIESAFPTVQQPIYGIGPRRVKELQVEPGHVIFTKSGGIHGIRNPGTEPLVFVAFGYSAS